MATGNLVNFEKTSEISPIKDEFLASSSKQNFRSFWKKIENKSAFKLSIEGLIFLIFVNSSQIFFEGLLVITINKVQSFSYN